jgi:hypothetical protein
MVPSWSVSVTEARKHVDTIFLQNSVHTRDEFGAVFNSDMVKAAHVMNKDELAVCKGGISETSFDEAYVNVSS